MRPQLWLKIALLGSLALGSGLLPIGAQAETTPTAASTLQTSATVTVPATKGAPVTVQYRSDTGKTLAPDKTLTGDVGSHYTVTIPTFKDQVCTRVTGAIKGTFATTPSTVVLTYSPLKGAPVTKAATSKTSAPVKPSVTRSTPARTTATTPRQATPVTRAATTTSAPTTTTPGKGVVVLSKTPVRRSSTPKPIAAAATTKLPQAGTNVRATFQAVLGGLVLGLTTLLWVVGRHLKA